MRSATLSFRAAAQLLEAASCRNSAAACAQSLLPSSYKRTANSAAAATTYKTALDASTNFPCKRGQSTSASAAVTLDPVPAAATATAAATTTAAAAAATAAPAASTFYRRPLPSSCIAFSSKEGRELFKQAMLQGYLEAYWSLAEQYHTQDEPAYCGLSTLSMVLNALEIDPGRLWKGNWRWYSESVLESCEPLEVIKDRGISYRKLACLARCNGAACSVRDGADVSLDEFRRIVKHITAGGHGKCHLVIAYDRKVVRTYQLQHIAPTCITLHSRHFAQVVCCACSRIDLTAASLHI
jgi:Phytochelatin synthase